MECFSAIPASVLSKLSLTVEKSCSKGSEMESCPSSQSGMTLEPSMADRGGDSLMSSAGDSHVRTSANAGKGKESKVKGLVFGHTWQESLVKYDLVTHSWRTVNHLFEEVLPEYSVTLPVWGMTRSGVVLELAMPAQITNDFVHGCLRIPTITRCEYKGSVKKRFRGSPYYRGTKMSEGLRTSETDPTYLNPSFGELAMGWPTGWTIVSEPLAMDKFRQWWSLHGKC